jgi:hypothetical protein
VVERTPDDASPELPTEPAGEPTVAPTIGLDDRPLVEPGPAAVGPVVTPSRAPVAPSSVPVVARTVVPTTVDTPVTPGGPGALPDVTPRPVPALPLPVVARSVAGLPVAVQRAAETPEAPDLPITADATASEAEGVPADAAGPTALDLLGDRPIRVEERTIATPPLPPPLLPTTNAPAVQRSVPRAGVTHGGPGGSPPWPAIPAQRTEASAAPLPLAPPALAWPPPPRAVEPTLVRPVPAPGLTVQAVAAGRAPGPPRTVQRVVVEPLASGTGTVLPEPSVTPTPFVPDPSRSAPLSSPGAALPPVAAPTSTPPVGASLHVQRATTTFPAALAEPVGSRPPVPESPRAPTYESMPASIRSMPLQRLFSATTPQTPRPALPTRPSEPAPERFDHVADAAQTVEAASGGTEVAIRWEQPQATAQRAEESGGEASGAPAPETPSAVGVASALGSTAPTPAKPGGTDMDELARRLYAPMSALLRAELWLDRERSGRSMTR